MIEARRSPVGARRPAMEPRRPAIVPGRVSVNPSAVLVIGLLVTALFVTGLMLLWSRSTYDYWGALVVGPVLLLVSLPILARQARREQDQRLFWILVAALALKLLASMARAYVSFVVYNKADANVYHDAGASMAGRFLSGDFDTGLESLTETNFIKLLTGVIYTVIRPTLLGGFLVFSWLGFWGLFLFYRAFQLAVPMGRSRSYAYLVFFLPSLLYWPSGLGKEAWMILALGIAAYGAARIFAGSTMAGLGVAAAGLFLASLVRAHFAGLFAVALAFGYLFRRSKREYRQLAPVAKALGVVALVVVAGYFVVQTQSFFESAGLEVEGSVASVGGISSVLEQASEQTGQGGSEFDPADVSQPSGLALAVATVLYRPLVIEAHNVTAVLAALESSLLLLLTVVRFRWILAAVRTVRDQPYVVFCGAFVAGGVIALSSIANFGILARERVLILPAYLVLLAIPPKSRRSEPDHRAAERVRGRVAH